MTLPLLQSELRGAADRYYPIGCYLNVSSEELIRITLRNRFNPIQCLDDVLQWWVEHGDDVSWSKVANVMDLLLRKDISMCIRMKYCGMAGSQVHKPLCTVNNNNTLLLWVYKATTNEIPVHTSWKLNAGGRTITIIHYIIIATNIIMNIINKKY